MAQLRRLYSPDHPSHGGFVATFPSGACKSVTWQSTERIVDTLDAAKKYTSELLAAMLKQGLMDDCERTNWASMTAAVQRMVSDWNAGLSEVRNDH
jgi:hypothetical protein